MTGIGDSGDVVGAYFDASRAYGFVLSSGRFTTLDPPGAISSQARGINARGDVVGEYRSADNKRHAYLYRKGVFTTIDLPGALSTAARAVNARGDIVGFYGDGTTLHGFVVSQ